MVEQLNSEKEARVVAKKLGIIDDEDAGYLSPEKKNSRKMDP